jgi:hypothetical protein
MRILYFLILFLMSNVCFSSKDWKYLGEYFENQYLDGLRAGLVKNSHPASDSNLLSWLKKAYYIYQIEAKKGNSEAQFRLGVLHQQSGLNQEADNWFSTASALGHYYASEYIKESSKRSDASKCSDYSNWLLTDSIPANESEFHVESLALMGQEECMLALGQKKRSSYWYHRALASVSHPLILPSALFELSSILEESLGPDHKAVVSLAEWAARRGSSQAEDWLESRTDDNGIRAFASVLTHQKRPMSAKKVLNGLKSNLITKESWDENEQYVDTQRRKIARQLKSDSKSALQGLGEVDQRFVFETIQKAPIKFVDPMLDLYKELGEYRTNDASVPQKILDFLQSTDPKEKDREKALRLLNRSLSTLEYKQLAEFSSQNQPLKNISTWFALESLGEIQQTLLLRRLLSLATDVSQVDLVLRKALAAVDTNEATLKKVLEIVQKSGQPDVLLFTFVKIFKNELLQLDIALQIEDLFSGAVRSYEPSSKVIEALKVFAALLDPSIATDPVTGFPKLELLRKSGAFIETSKRGSESVLLVEGIYTIERYRQAYLNFMASKFFEWDYTLGATLSERHLRAIRNQFGSVLDRLVNKAIQFSGHRREKDGFEDSRSLKRMAMQSLSANLAQKKLQLENLVNELLATQKNQNLEVDIDYSSLKNSEGLKTFKVVPAESDSFNVSPKDAKMKPDFSSVDKSPFFSHRSIRLQKNEVINIRVSGEWSPICALKRSGLGKDVSGVLIGSEGFRIHATSGQSSTTGTENRESTSRFKTKTKTHSWGLDSSRFTGGIGAGLGFIFGGPVGAAIGGGIGGIGGYSYSSQTTKGTTESIDTSKFKQSLDISSTTASFQGGIRLRDTPYPAFPAGSYIAIVISRDSARLYESIDAFVLGAHNSYVAPEDVELLFVVNDCNDGEIRAGQLSIQVQQMKAANPIIDELVSSMRHELQQFSRQGRVLVKEGGDLSSRIETLKAEVFANVKKDSVADFMSEPTLRTVFLHWLNREADKIVRWARIEEIGKQIVAVKFELDSISQQIALSDEGQSWVSSRINGLVKTVRHIPLYESILEVVKYANKFITPVLNLYYPNGLSFVPQTESHAEAVGEGDHLSVETLADGVIDLSKQLLKGLEELHSIKSQTPNFVIIRFPRPGTVLSEYQNRMMPVIRDGRAQMLWNCLFQVGKCADDWALQLHFNDLYQNGTQNSLSLHLETPVILDMALLFGVDDLLEAKHLQTQFHTAIIDMEVGAEQVFSMQSGPRRFMLSDEDLGIHQIRLGFIGSGDRLISALEQAESSLTTGLETAKGLSPFSAFRFGMADRTTLQLITDTLNGSLDDYSSQLTDVFLIIKVMSTKRRKTLDWILR